MLNKENNSKNTAINSMALTRTVLANERTLLAYVRTSLTMLVTGVGILKFIEDGMTVLTIGWGMILGGIVILIAGIIRYQKLSNNLLTRK